jgi:hypothetical protein
LTCTWNLTWTWSEVKRGEVKLNVTFRYVTLRNGNVTLSTWYVT